VLTAACAVLGVVIGSFLNVVIARVPVHASLGGRSRCPRCQRTLTAGELVPVASWAVQRGRCRGCGNPISAQYPIVELLTSAAFALLAVRFGWSLELTAYLAVTALLIALSGIDIHTKTLPRRLIYLAGAVSVPLLMLAAIIDDEPRRIVTMALGTLVAGGFFLGLHLLRPDAMGFGDVRLSFLLGASLGWLGILHVPVGLFLGFLSGAVAGVVAMTVGSAGRKTAVPFGPFMALGAYVAFLGGRQLVALWGY
jgi:leader peptidase (prepilin peptidase)/N-methyltransferase